MFELKKYKIVKNFNGYIVGQVVAFSGADANKYADKICSLAVAKPILEVKEEVKQDIKEVKAVEEIEAIKEIKEVKEPKKAKRVRKAKKEEKGA